MANIITELHLEMSDNWYVTKKLNSVGRVGENTVTKLIIEPTEILDNVTYEIEIMSADGSKNVAELTIDGTELYLILTANMLTTSGIMKMQVRGLFTDGSIKKSNIFELKVNRSISATEHYEEYAVTIFDQLVQDCRDIIEGAESYAIRAETAAVNAEAYEQSASASAEAASASEATASTASEAAVNAAASAETSANTASTSAETATTAANSASASASTAQTSAQTAHSASVTAQSASEAAQTASTAAQTAATSAENSASSASTAANNASASATSAASSATAASNSATSATEAASNAATSETNAAASASSASASAANANTSATNAANSAVAAATSATNAHNSEVNASTSETNASTSATEAAALAESIAASVAQINKNTYRINDLEAIIAGYQLADLPTGAVASVTDGTDLLMPSLKVGIEPVQDLHGYAHSWAGGVEKNKINLADITTPSAGFVYNREPVNLAVNTYTLSFNFTGSSGSISISLRNGETVVSTLQDQPLVDGLNTFTMPTLSNNADSISLYAGIGGTYKNFMLEVGSQATTYEPYSNICPISGWTAANVNVSPTTSAEDGTTYTIEFRDGDNPLAIYGGTLDVTSGELVVDRALLYVDGSFNVATVLYDSNSQLYYTVVKTNLGAPANNPLPKSDKFIPFGSVRIGNCYITNYGNYLLAFLPDQSADTVAKATQWFADNPTQFVYELATPVTYHLTPTQVRTLVGNNNIWADTGDIISGKYYKSLT